MEELEVRAIRLEERQECLDLWCAVWPGDSAAYFRRYFYGDREFLPYYTRVGVLHGRVVSAVQICKRTVACGDQVLTMGGIANVATLPEYRGRGYNTQCLRSAIAVMEADAMDFSLLFTGIHDYYARQGFETLEKLWLSGTVRQDFAPVPSPFLVRSALPSDLESIERCHAAYNRSRPIAVQRYPAYWRDWLNIYPDHLPDTLLVATDASDTVVGYIQTGVFNSAIPYSADAAEVRVIEYGTLDPGDVQVSSAAEEGQNWIPAQIETGIARALLEAVVLRMPSVAAGGVLRLEIGPEASVLKALNSILVRVEEHYNRSGMVRLLHRDNLLRSMTMEWNDRWLRAGRPEGSVSFDTPYGGVAVVGEGALLRVMPTDEMEMGEGEVRLSQATLFGLLFGMLLPDQATSDISLHPFLRALFPERATVYYGADGF